MPMVMLQQQTIMPFIIMQQLHMPPAIMVQRFCSMVADVLSSHVHMIFMPSLHFSIFMVQRGTIIHCGVVGMVAVPPIVPDIIGFIPAIMPVRSIIIAVVIVLPFGVNLGLGGSRQSVSPIDSSLCQPGSRMQEKSIKICRWITTILIFLVKYLTASGHFVARYANPAPPTCHEPTLENARPNPA